MSIQSEITRITNKRNDSFTAVANKGVTVPSGSTIDDLPGLIALIQTGSGGSGGLVYQDENGYVHLSDTGGAAIGIVDTLDTNGGTIRNIYGIDLSNDTVTAADLAQGVTAHNAQGQAITGTASGGYTAVDWLDHTKPTGAIVSSANIISSNAADYNYTFRGHTGITSIHLTNAIYIPNSFAYRATALQTFVGEKANTSDSAPFFGCSNLSAVDLASGGNLGMDFIGNSPCNVLIIRGDTLSTISNYNTFRASVFASGRAGGTIYINKSVYDHLGDNSALDYKAATNWSIIDGYGTITWAKIEGSIYETQYADGTTIPTS